MGDIHAALHWHVTLHVDNSFRCWPWIPDQRGLLNNISKQRFWETQGMKKIFGRKSYFG